jgi:hypothetical protein
LRPAAATENQAIICRSAQQPQSSTTGVAVMSKGMEQKKEAKKKPTKSLKEKRAEKKAKKESRGF